MRTLQDLEIEFGYMGRGQEILSQFVLPCLESCVGYDRITSYYNFASLLSIAEGLQSVYERKGKMRLVLGIHSVPIELAEATVRREYLQSQIEEIRQEIAEGVVSLSDSLSKRKLATLAWMIEDGLLEVKAASLSGAGIFHPKTLIFRDGEDNRVVAVGSSNETGSGHGDNVEQLMVACSWDGLGAVKKQETFFESLWTERFEDAEVFEITADLARTIIDNLGPEYAKREARNVETSPARDVINLAAEMPANFFISGKIPALYQHQERAVIEALSRWPVRVLLADEVGLGKTFEAAAVLTYLVRFCGVKRVLILTPKAVLKQWQEELHDHFGLDVWMFDSAIKSYVNPNGGLIKIGSSNPIGAKSPGLMLMSAQYARGSGKQKSIFDRSGAVLPELLILDEAHSARVSKDLTGSTKTTKIYEMLEGVTKKIPHVVFATATPMQKEASEYHAMLKLLGLPNAWGKIRPYITSLGLVSSDESPSANDAYVAGKLLRSTMSLMKPSLDGLDVEERAVLQGLLSINPDAENYIYADYVCSQWSVLKNVFIKLHPAHLLTVRNTRRSLSEIGYSFPTRTLKAESLTDSSDVQLFYMNVEQYINDQYFLVEKALHPEKKFNVGFVRISYQQRLASSLYSCRESVKRRFSKLDELKKRLEDGSFADGSCRLAAEDSGLGKR